MDDVEEKRVFGDRVGATELLVAAAIGVVSVDVSGDRVGRFGVARRCDPVDLAAGDGLVAVATSNDVLVRPPGTDAFLEASFGPAVAVGVDHGVVAADPDGRIARLDAPRRGDDGRSVVADDWSDVGPLDAAVRAIDPPLLATSAGVYRLTGLDYVGLSDVNDVAAAGPLAATAGGLYSLGNGWMDELDGAFYVVKASDGRAHAATDETLYQRQSGDWATVDLPAGGSVVDVVYGEVAYAVTEDGALLIEGEDGWRAHPLGVDGVVGCVDA